MPPKMNHEDTMVLSTLTLAQVGDAVFDLMARTRLCMTGITTAKMLHNSRVKIVNAVAQSAAAAAITEKLNENERSVYNRGRNAHTFHVPKAATRAQYQTATALETLFGYLWLTGNTARLEELFDEVVLC